MVTSQELAIRLARTIVSDLVAYNKDLVEDGIVNDNLFEVMGSKIDEGLRFFKDQVDESITDSSNIFNDALVDILFGEAEVESKIW